MKILKTAILIDKEQRKITITMLAHVSTKFSVLEAHATKAVKKSKEVFAYWKSVSQATVTNHGLQKDSYGSGLDGYRYFEVLYTL